MRLGRHVAHLPRMARPRCLTGLGISTTGCVKSDLVYVHCPEPSQVFKKIEKQLPQLTTLDLQYVSPDLLKARNLELAVPGIYPNSSQRFDLCTHRLTGTYQSGRPIITIVSFATKLMVISSKQRPRRLVLRGSDGIDYQFVLKGIVPTYLCEVHDPHRRCLPTHRACRSRRPSTGRTCDAVVQSGQYITLCRHGQFQAKAEYSTFPGNPARTQCRIVGMGEGQRHFACTRSRLS